MVRRIDGKLREVYLDRTNQLCIETNTPLIEDLIVEGYNYVLTSRFLSDPSERRYSQYRQMSDGRFLVGLKEVNNAEKILKIRNLLEEGIHLWEENLNVDNNFLAN